MTVIHRVQEETETLAEWFGVCEREGNWVRTAKAGTDRDGFSEALLGVDEEGWFPIRVRASEYEADVIGSVSVVPSLTARSHRAAHMPILFSIVVQPRVMPDLLARCPETGDFVSTGRETTRETLETATREAFVCPDCDQQHALADVQLLLTNGSGSQAPEGSPGDAPSLDDTPAWVAECSPQEVYWRARYEEANRSTVDDHLDEAIDAFKSTITKTVTLANQPKAGPGSTITTVEWRRVEAIISLPVAAYSIVQLVQNWPSVAPTHVAVLFVSVALALDVLGVTPRDT